MNKRLLSWLLVGIIAVLLLLISLLVWDSLHKDDTIAIPPPATQVTQSAQIWEPNTVQTEPSQQPTEQIKVNPYDQCLQDYADYVLPESNSRFLRMQEVADLPDTALTVAQQEIHARYGAAFADYDLQDYFTARSWYRVGSGNYILNDYEKTNLLLLETQQSLRDGTFSNPYTRELAGDYALPESNSRPLMENELFAFTKNQLIIARNEIFARHGNVFSDREIQAYFCTKSWYEPRTSEGIPVNMINSAEHHNIALIMQIEDVAGEDGCRVETVTAYEQIGTMDAWGHCYHIPGLRDVPNANEVNSLLLQEFRPVADGTTEEYHMSYFLGQKDYVTSLVIRTVGNSDLPTYHIRNFSSVTGRELSDAEVLSVFGMTEEQGREMIKQCLTELSDEAEQTYEDYIPEYRERTLSDQNIDAVRVYIDPTGNLRFTGRVHVPAGNGGYTTTFGPEEGTKWYPCPVCGNAYFD